MRLLRLLCGMTAVLLGSASGTLRGDEPSPPYQNTSVSARLNVAVDPNTEVVHFVRDNINPNVVTKIYVLKHADPYEIRQNLVDLVQVRKVNSSDTGIQAIQYNDGTKMLMISAENYRFDSHPNGEGFDQLVRVLDSPGITSVSGKPVYFYLPKFRSGEELREMVENVGASMFGDETENIGGGDRIRCDGPMNVMWLRTAPFSRKNIEMMLREYDTAYPEVRAKITIYELYAENDAKMGLDFQAWKNNDGIDLFNGGARFMQNYTPDGSNLSQGAGWSDVKYLNFNPKWNTKYVDFLVSKGKAKVLHSSELSVRNNTSASIERTSQIFFAKAEPIEDSSYTVGYINLPNVAFSSTPEAGKTVVTATTNHGDPVTIVMNGGTASLTILQMAKNPEVANYYQMDIKNGYFTVNGSYAGTSVEAGSVKVVSYALNDKGVLTGTPVEFTGENIPAQKGNRIFSEASGEFGFKMTITPSITEKATILNVQIANSSLIGYESSGEPRIQKSAELSSKFMVSNSGTKLVIGGIEKRDVVRVSGGLPYFKDLPVIGWLFSTESESTKRSQLLVVAEVIPVRPEDSLSAGESDEIRKIREKLKKAGDSNDWGYRQQMMDPDRNK